MKLLSILFITLFSASLYAQDTRNCDIRSASTVTLAVETAVLNLFKDNGIELEEGFTYESAIQDAVIYNKSVMGDAFDIFYTDILVYKLQDWVTNKYAILNDRTLFFEVNYNSITSEDGTSSYVCFETGKSSNEIISSVTSVNKL